DVAAVAPPPDAQRLRAPAGPGPDRGHLSADGSDRLLGDEAGAARFGRGILAPGDRRDAGPARLKADAPFRDPVPRASLESRRPRGMTLAPGDAPTGWRGLAGVGNSVEDHH